jgi:hypothetical protein
VVGRRENSFTELAYLCTSANSTDVSSSLHLVRSFCVRLNVCPSMFLCDATRCLSWTQDHGMEHTTRTIFYRCTCYMQNSAEPDTKKASQGVTPIMRLHAARAAGLYRWVTIRSRSIKPSKSQVLSREDETARTERLQQLPLNASASMQAYHRSFCITFHAFSLAIPRRADPQRKLQPPRGRHRPFKPIAVWTSRQGT